MKLRLKEIFQYYLLMKEIKLNRGYVALVDDEDFERLSKFNWRVSVHKKKRVAYAVAVVKLHRLALDVSDREILVDHRNGNGLDCQKLNLRRCSSAQNAANRKAGRNSKSGLKGVYFHKASKSWMSRIKRGERVCVTYHKDKFRAAVEYDAWARVLDGEFARTNFTLCPLVVRQTAEDIWGKEVPVMRNGELV